MNEIDTWQSMTSWNPSSYDKPHGHSWNLVYLVLNLAQCLLNGLVIYGTLAHNRLYAELISNASSRLFFTMSIGRCLYGISQMVVRTALHVQNEWAYLTCLAHAAINHFFIVVIIMFLGVLAFEQGVTILYLRRFHAEHANWVTATIYIVSGLWTTFQLLPPWRPMYSAGGDFCYSTAWADWPALINLTLALGMIVTLAVAYAVIIARLSWTLGRGNHRRQRAQDTGPTKTFLNRDDYDVTYDQQQQPSAGHSSDGKLLASVSNSRNRSQDGRPKLTGPHKKSAEKSREAKIQRQFIIRGALSVMTACVLFGVMWVACFTVYTQKKQVDVFYGTATTSCLFIGMVLDPIVATVQEPRLRRAFKEVMFARGSKLHKPSSSSMSLGTPTDSQSVSSSQRIQNNHLMSVM